MILYHLHEGKFRKTERTATDPMKRFKAHSQLSRRSRAPVR